MTYNQGDMPGDPDDYVDYDDYAGENPDPFATILPEAKASGKKGNKNKADKKDKKAAIITTYEGYTFTVLDKLTPGEPAPWERTRKKLLPFSSKEIYDRAVADQKDSRHSSLIQFQKLGPKQQTIVTRLLDDKNDDEKDPNAVWSLFCVKRLYEEYKHTWRTYRVNNALRVTIERHDRAADKISEAGGSKSALPTSEVDDIFDINKPRKKKDPASKEAKTGKKNNKKKPAPVEDPFTGWNDVPQQNPPMDPFAGQPEPYPQPYDNPHPFQPQDQFPPPQGQYPPQAPIDPFDMRDVQGAIPVPMDERDMNVPPAVPMAPPHEQPNAFQPYPHIYPQPDPNAFDAFDDRQPREFASRVPGTSARHNRDASGHRHRSRSLGHDPDRSYSRSRRRDSSDSERVRRIEERFGEKLDRNQERMAEKIDTLTGMMSLAVATNKVSNWPTGGGMPSPSNTTSRDSGSSQRSWGRGRSTPATSPERYDHRDRRSPKGSLKRRQSYSRLTKPHYRAGRRRDYPEEGFVLEPGISYRHGRDHHDRAREGEWDDYPRERHDDRSPRAQPPVLNHISDRVRPAYLKRAYTEGTDFMRDDRRDFRDDRRDFRDERRDSMFINEEPRRRHRDEYRGDAFRDRY